MRRLDSFVLTCLVALAPAVSMGQAIVPGPCATSTLGSGAVVMTCVPTSGWTGDLLVYAHGYTATTEPVALQNLTLPDGTSLPGVVQSLGYAFATTSYRRNGLAVLEGVEDLNDLITAFPSLAGQAPARVFLVGVSEGALVSTLAIERTPALLSGALAACGPIGDFHRQVDYLGDFRVVFDFLYPGTLPPSAVAIPAAAMANWDSLQAQVRAAVAGDPARAAALLATAHAEAAPDAVTTAVDVLWYNVFATNDAADRLGGNPFDNRNRVYSGSGADAVLNEQVARFDADPRALEALGAFETSGAATLPLVLMHTRGDDVVPFWHQTLYLDKAHRAGRDLTAFTIERSGHCNFTSLELILAFGTMVGQAAPAHP